MEYVERSQSHTQTQLSNVELALRDALASMSDAGSDAHSQIASQLAFIHSLQASVAAGIPVSEASIQSALNRVQQESTQIALRKSEQQTIAAALAEQMHLAEEARLSQEASDFRSYETEAFGRIQELASVNGIDLSEFEHNRAEILARREAAEAAGDTVEAYKQDALLAANNRHGMTLVDASEEEQERARREEEAAKERYLRQVEIMAMREAQRTGLSGDDASEYVYARRQRAESELTAERQSHYPAAPESAIAQQTELAETTQTRNEILADQGMSIQPVLLDEAPEDIAITTDDALSNDGELIMLLSMTEADLHGSLKPLPTGSAKDARNLVTEL